MFNIVKNDRRINVIVQDTVALNNLVVDVIKKIDPDYDKYTPSENTKLFKSIFERYLLKELTKLSIIENEAYLVNVTLGEKKCAYVFSKIKSDKIDSGYTIGLTLQG